MTNHCRHARQAGLVSNLLALALLTLPLPTHAGAQPGAVATHDAVIATRS